MRVLKMEIKICALREKVLNLMSLFDARHRLRDCVSRGKNSVAQLPSLESFGFGGFKADFERVIRDWEMQLCELDAEITSQLSTLDSDARLHIMLVYIRTLDTWKLPYERERDWDQRQRITNVWCRKGWRWEQEHREQCSVCSETHKQCLLASKSMWLNIVGLGDSLAIDKFMHRHWSSWRWARESHDLLMLDWLLLATLPNLKEELAVRIEAWYAARSCRRMLERI